MESSGGWEITVIKRQPRFATVQAEPDRTRAAITDLRTGFSPPIWPARRPRPPCPVPLTRVGLQDRDGPAANLQMEAAVAWIILTFAGVLEIVWAYSMKLSDGFTKLG